MSDTSQLSRQEVGSRFSIPDPQSAEVQSNSLECSIRSEAGAPSVPGTHGPVQTPPLVTNMETQLAFERGFLKGWHAAIESQSQIDWECVKIGGTD